MQQAVSSLLNIAPKLTSELVGPTMDQAVVLLDALSHPLAPDDISTLISLLPSDGDDACGLNWTILHAIEASPDWPIWNLLDDSQNEWVDIFLVRLKNSGIERP